MAPVERQAASPRLGPHEQPDHLREEPDGQHQTSHPCSGPGGCSRDPVCFTRGRSLIPGTVAGARPWGTRARQACATGEAPVLHDPTQRRLQPARTPWRTVLGPGSHEGEHVVVTAHRSSGRCRRLDRSPASTGASMRSSRTRHNSSRCGDGRAHKISSTLKRPGGRRRCPRSAANCLRHDDP